MIDLKIEDMYDLMGTEYHTFVFMHSKIHNPGLTEITYMAFLKVLSEIIKDRKDVIFLYGIIEEDMKLTQALGV